MLDVSHRFRVSEEGAAPPDELAVGIDLPFAAEVADQVEMERGAVPAAEILESHPECQVHRAADLLVEKDVPGEAVDFVVEAKGDLAHPSRALVHVEQCPQIGLSPGGLRGYDPAVLETEAHVVDLPPCVDRGEAEPERPVDAGLDRARVDLAVRDVVEPARRCPRPAFDGDRQVGVFADDPKLPHRSKLAGPGLKLLTDAAPVADRIVVENVAGAKDEVL